MLVLVPFAKVPFWYMFLSHSLMSVWMVMRPALTCPGNICQTQLALFPSGSNARHVGFRESPPCIYACLHLSTSQKTLSDSSALILNFPQGIGAQPAATHAAMQVPNPALQARIAIGVPAPAVTVPKVTPAAA